ncbi:MAG: hypothetical protein JW940_10910 [Polyangiaceae bacterium]|nr:hypothetical protein [Polyangiaceae bacterium]
MKAAWTLGAVCVAIQVPFAAAATPKPECFVVRQPTEYDEETETAVLDLFSDLPDEETDPDGYLLAQWRIYSTFPLPYNGLKVADILAERERASRQVPARLRGVSSFQILLEVSRQQDLTGKQQPAILQARGRVRQAMERQRMVLTVIARSTRPVVPHVRVGASTCPGPLRLPSGVAFRDAVFQREGRRSVWVDGYGHVLTVDVSNPSQQILIDVAEPVSRAKAAEGLDYWLLGSGVAATVVGFGGAIGAHFWAEDVERSAYCPNRQCTGENGRRIETAMLLEDMREPLIGVGIIGLGLVGYALWPLVAPAPKRDAAPKANALASVTRDGVGLSFGTEF